MREKRFIFTVTTGRSGTGFLSYILGHFNDTVSVHEPEPPYDECMRIVQSEPQLATDFLLNRKLPAISKAAARAQIYIETSHVFCKGFLEPWLHLPDIPVPDLIILDRDIRKVALSLFTLQTIPGRTDTGLRWYLSPSDETCLTSIHNWETLNDYQLCYWYCLEIEERKNVYGTMVTEKGARCVRTSIESLKSFRGLRQLRKQLALPRISLDGWLRYSIRRCRTVNSQRDKKVGHSYSDTELQMLEHEVKQRLTRRSARAPLGLAPR